MVLASPVCCAVMLHVPRLARIALAPEMVQTPGELEMKLTVRPALDVATKGTGIALKFCGPGPVKLIVWLVLATIRLNACEALGGVVLAAPKVSGNVPACVGVPESTPLLGLRESPVGNAPVTENVNVDGVPVAVTVNVMPD